MVAAFFAAVICLPGRAATDPLDDVYVAIADVDRERAEALLDAQDAAAGADPAALTAWLGARLDLLAADDTIAGTDIDALPARLDTLAARIDSVPVDSMASTDLRARLAIVRAFLTKDTERALGSAASLQARAGERPETRAEAAHWRARAALVLGRAGEAESALRVALTDWARLEGRRARWREVDDLAFLGEALERSGRSEEALSAFQHSAILAARSFPDSSTLSLRAGNRYAGRLESLGRYGESIEARETVLAAARRRYGNGGAIVAVAEAGLGATLQKLGDYPASRRHFEVAEALLKPGTRIDPRDRVVISNNYANLLQEMGETELALRHYRDAVERLSELPAPTRMRAVLLANIGNTEFRLGRYAAAETDFREALALREQVEGGQHVGITYALEGLAATALVQKHFHDAEMHFRRALDIRERALPADHPLLAVARFGVALSLWGQKDTAGAFQYALQAAEHQQALLANVASEFSDRQGVAFRDLLVPAAALVVTLAAERGDADSIATAWRLVMAERGIVARSSARRLAAARSAQDTALAPLWQAWREANTALTAAWLSRDTKPERLEALRVAAEQAEQAFWRRAGNAHGGDLITTPALPELARALPEHARLVAVGEGLAADPARALIAGHGQNPEEWYAFDLTREGTPRLLRLGRIEALSAEARAWYAALRDPSSAFGELRRRGTAVRRALIDPLRLAGDPGLLFFVPQGDLFRVNLAALPLEDGYLIERGWRVHTFAHESDLLVQTTPHWRGRAVLAGAPDFRPADAGIAMASRQVCVGASQQGFTAIPYAGQELLRLQSVLAGTGDDGNHIELLSGAEATTARVAAALPGATVVHLATHGFSLDETCAAQGASRAVTLEAAQGDALARPALSGLAFSGARLDGRLSAEGVLSAEDLAALDLSRTEWVVLSACDSGLGPIDRGEGVFGMRRALRLAGARTVVMSLWEVDDAATAALMEALYRARFSAHRDVPTALGDAMLEVITARRQASQSDHPYYWAAFVDEGGWR